MNNQTNICHTTIQNVDGSNNASSNCEREKFTETQTNCSKEYSSTESASSSTKRFGCAHYKRRAKFVVSNYLIDFFYLI